MKSLAQRVATLAVYCLAAISAPVLARGASEPQDLQTVTLNAGIHNIRAQVARTPDEREIGLMFRRSMPASDGMIFIFDDDAQQCFWMKNTLIPLAVAFVSTDGTVANVDEMQAQTLNSHCSSRPVRFVLEMNQGWFSKRGIKAGSKLTGPLFSH